jgi:hypothetical protein
MRRFRVALIGVALLLSLGGGASAQREQPGDCGYYTNRDGQSVPRPCGHSRYDRPPQGATAVCRDGQFSYSRHHSGTCSGHGGVRNWLR